jgi:uncharacterized membrane protein
MLAPSIAITEFPFFTFLFADLHAHLIALPLTLLALGIMVGLLTEWNGSRWHGFVLVALLALTCGALFATNTWDYPTYTGLGLAGIALWAWWRSPRAGWRFASRDGLIAAALLVVGSLLASKASSRASSRVASRRRCFAMSRSTVSFSSRSSLGLSLKR